LAGLAFSFSHIGDFDVQTRKIDSVTLPVIIVKDAEDDLDNYKIDQKKSFLQFWEDTKEERERRTKND
jgi:hypothetical protein